MTSTTHHNTTQHTTTHRNTSQRNATQRNTTQHNTTQHNTTQHNTTHHNTTQHNTTQHNTTQHNTTQHNTTQRNTTQHNTTQHNTTQHNTTQHNTTQHNTTQHNTTQHNTTQHNTTQHNTTQHNTTHCNAAHHHTSQCNAIQYNGKSEIQHDKCNRIIIGEYHCQDCVHEVLPRAPLAQALPCPNTEARLTVVFLTFSVLVHKGDGGYALPSARRMRLRWMPLACERVDAFPLPAPRHPTAPAPGAPARGHRRGSEGPLALLHGCTRVHATSPSAPGLRRCCATRVCLWGRPGAWGGGGGGTGLPRHGPPHCNAHGGSGVSGLRCAGALGLGALALCLRKWGPCALPCVPHPLRTGTGRRRGALLRRADRRPPASCGGRGVSGAPLLGGGGCDGVYVRLGGGGCPGLQGMGGAMTGWGRGEGVSLWPSQSRRARRRRCRETGLREGSAPCHVPRSNTRACRAPKNSVGTSRVPCSTQ